MAKHYPAGLVWVHMVYDYLWLIAHYQFDSQMELQRGPVDFYRAIPSDSSQSLLKYKAGC
jgi:hypothetical protein